MKIIQGIYNEAKVFTDNFDDVTVAQIETFLNEELTKNAKDTIEIQSLLKPLYNFKAAEFQGWRKK